MRCVFVLSLILASALAIPAQEATKPLHDLDFESYWSTEEIYRYMDELVVQFPDFAEVEVMGISSQNRQIRGIHIKNFERSAQETLPIIFVTGGKVSRDWITIMAAVNIIHELLENYAENQHIVDNVEWFILPVANPDGYEFSRTEGNRNWIKNRAAIAGSDCIGVNIERNFDFNWKLGPFSTENPCSNSFGGLAANSEEETRTIQFATDVFRDTLQAYITLKGGVPTFQSAISYPFSSNNELFRTSFRDEMGIANIMADAIWRQSGARYRAMSEGTRLLAGTSADYAVGVDFVPFAYSIYSPIANAGNAWETPVEDINGVVRDMWPGIVALGEYIAQLPMIIPVKKDV